ncbi:MAG: hypothetical protein ACYTG6_14745 [Planctomycetota bacterium]
MTLTLENPHPIATPPVPLTIGLAAFGAFIPDVPVATVAAPGMDPGERRRITKQIPRRAEPGIERLAQMMAAGLAMSPERIRVYRRLLHARRRGKGESERAQHMRLLLEEYRRRLSERRAAVSHGSERPLDDLEGLARTMFSEAYGLQAPHYCKDEETHLEPRQPANVVVRSPDHQIMVHRHMGFFEHVRPGKANPMPFAVGTWRARMGAPTDGRACVMTVRELSEGWSAELGPGAWGDALPAGRYLAIVTPPHDATEGRLIVDVTDVTSGEVCPVEWSWGKRADHP